MKHSNPTAGVAPHARRRALRKQTLAMACCLALAFPLAAQAQQAEQAADQTVETLDTVKVTGIRAAIATAVETKNESTSIVEVVSAEDIGKLPDISIADSISRLPGLTMQRVDGRAQVIHIRGMSEQFGGTLLNGREQVSTGGSRGVELDQYPAELINGVTVYKTPDATLVGQGLSGTIDMQSIRPLDFDGRRVTFAGQGEYNSLGKLIDGSSDKGYRASASYVDQFADDTIGFAIGVARMDSPFQEQQEKAWWWGNPDAWGAPQPGKPADAVARQAGEASLKSRDITRDGVMAVLEFKPGEQFHSILDVYYSTFEQNEAENSIMWNNDPWYSHPTLGQVTYSNVGTTLVGGVPVVTSGTLNGVGALNMLNETNQRDDKLFSAGWLNTFRWSDIYTLKTDLSYSRAESERTMLELQSAFGTPRNIDFDLRTGKGFNNFTIPGLTDPSQIYLGMDAMGWGRDGRTDRAWTEDTLKSGRLELNRQVESSDFLRSYDVGVNFTRRNKDREYIAHYVDLKNGRAPVRMDTVPHGYASMDFIGLGDVINFNAHDLLGRYYDLRYEASENDLMKNYGVEEDIKTFYAKANIDMDLTDEVRLRGNVGVQYIRSEQSSTGPTVARDAVSNEWVIAGGQTIGTSYGDILPSMNLSTDFGDGLLLRFAAAKTLMRGPIEQMGAYTTAGVDVTTREWSGSGGNPKLEPYRATAYDLSLEKYFGPTTYAALAVFYKDLETYIYTQNVRWDFTGYDDLGITPISNWGNFSTPVNGSGGYMRGAELSGALGGDMIHPALDGFGLLFNASYTESSIDPDGPGGSDTDTLPGLSKVVANATVYYEKHGFSARISQRYRDEYRGEYASLFGDRIYQNTMAERTMDMQVGYDFPESSKLSGLSVLLQVNNVTNEPYRTETTAGGIDQMIYLPSEYKEYGRQYLLGFRYKL
jgi:iron complex outermembrane receptor protein